ncbi:hypothetical protein SLS62_004937 [Diatrype stigma]|uniref:Uncharacterized protein n=1 Tax=Diatrype stigma TaxID=117547 RepID=A0AAN9YNS7_9PEZI
MGTYIDDTRPNCSRDARFPQEAGPGRALAAAQSPNMAGACHRIPCQPIRTEMPSACLPWPPFAVATPLLRLVNAYGDAADPEARCRAGLTS